MMAGVETEVVYSAAAVLVPGVLAVRMLLVERAARRRALALPPPQQKVRQPNDVSQGPAIYKVHVVGDEGWVNLGTSIEAADSLTGNPELVAKAVTVETEAGLRLALREGAPLKVHTLGGARRELVESITTDDGGIKQRFSFEVDGSTWFLLEGAVPESAAGHPFRAGSIELLPAGERYAINPPPPKRSEFSSMGCVTHPLAIGGVLWVLSADSTLGKIAAWVVWTLGVLSLLLAASVAASEFREG
jgi:hypothetical protein